MQKKEFLLLILALALLLVGIFDHSLWTPDEPRVADISRTMAITGDYLIPHLGEDPFLEQPPLYYALTGLLWKIFGTGNEGFGRLSSVFFALGTLMVVFFGMRSLYDSKTATQASLILATTVGFFMASHKMLVDNALVFFITAALFAFLLAYRGTFKPGYPIFWLCLSGAFLTKGIIGLAIPGISVCLFVIWQKDFASIKRAWVIRGIILLAAILGAWGGILYLRGGTEFLYTFFWYNNLGRFLNMGVYKGGHVNPFYYYAPVLFSEGMPWSFILIPTIVFLKKPDERLRFFYCWFFGGLLFLSLASTKRGLYLLPMYPAMAIIITLWVERAAQEAASQWEKHWLRFTATLVGLAGLGLPIAYMMIGGSLPVAAAVFILSMAIQWFLFKNLPFTITERVICGWAILIIAWSTVFFPQVDTFKSYKGFFSEAGKAVGKADIIGYDLTETALALSSFYGGFSIENVTDRKQFLDLVSTGNTRYVLFLPRKNDIEVRNLLESTGHMLLHIDNKITDVIHIPEWSGLRPQLTNKESMRPTELWLLSKSSTPKGIK
jgi:4-amino-4-deoxy-L-arabinose transferase-like glycosyltransferase